MRAVVHFLARFGRWGATCVAVLCLPLSLAQAKQPAANVLATQQIRLAGPAATVSFPLLRLVAAQPLADQGITFTFTLWRDPDQLRALTLEQGADFVAMPSNVAANLYNRGVPLRLLLISEWGMLKILSSNDAAHRLRDLAGEEIAVPFRADMPDILLQVLARAQGLDPRRDFSLRYVASPMDAAQLLISGKVKHALLAEPIVSQVLHKSQSFPANIMAPNLSVAVDLQQEWGQVWEREPQVPQAGMVVLGAVAQQADLLERLYAAYDEAAQWCKAQAKECGQLVAKEISLLQADAVRAAVEQSPHRIVDAASARAELEFFYQLLAENQPQLIGGALPDDGFYQAGTTAVLEQE